MSIPLGRRLLLWGPPVIYMSFIFFLSSESDPLPTVTHLFWDKALHATGYSLLAALVVRACTGEGWPWGLAWIMGIVAASAYGVTDEFHQSFVVGRDSEVLDWVADTVGGAVGASAFVGFLQVWHQHVLSRWPGLSRLHVLVGTR
jgi:VanZ family protein